MKLTKISTLAAMGILSAACFAQGRREVAICPWTFTDGNVTSRTMVIDTIRGILEHNGFAVLPQHDMEDRYSHFGGGIGWHRANPDLGDLARWAAASGANHLVFGRTSWHTRSIWVGTGPKTISTATVDLYVYNARTNTVTYQRQGATGRSDESENAVKDVLDVFVTPLVTVVSGGPATPREQRAAQIAIGRALRPWIRRTENRNR
jgi:hypothetical protein